MRIGGGMRTAQNRRGTVYSVSLIVGAPSFSPYRSFGLAIAHSPFRQPNRRSRAILTIPQDRFVPRRPYKRRHRSVLARRNGRLH
jgi:hypothetical protein